MKTLRQQSRCTALAETGDWRRESGDGRRMEEKDREWVRHPSREMQKRRNPSGGMWLGCAPTARNATLRSEQPQLSLHFTTLMVEADWSGPD